MPCGASAAPARAARVVLMMPGRPVHERRAAGPPATPTPTAAVTATAVAGTRIAAAAAAHSLQILVLLLHAAILAGSAWSVRGLCDCGVAGGAWRKQQGHTCGGQVAAATVHAHAYRKTRANRAHTEGDERFR